MTGASKSRLRESGWLLFAIIASSIWCVSASARLSATFDEPTYISLGLESWRTGSYKPLLDLGTLPLPCQVQTLPLHLWERWRGEPFDPTTDIERLLPIARLGTLPFWWLLLLYGWLAGRQMAGVWGGRLALLFLACEPNLLAHASLATTDVAVTACLVALLYHFRAGRDGPWRRRVLIPGIWFGLAVLAKASGYFFGIIGLAMVELEHQWTALAGTTEGRARLGAAVTALYRKPFRRDLFQLCSLGLLGVFCYCGSDGLPSPSFIAWARQLPDSPLRTATVWIAEHLCIFSNAGVALVRQVRHNVQGHGVFLLEHVEKRAIWYYFPVALCIKSPLPLLALPMLLAVLCRRALRNWACLTTLALLLFTLVCRVQTGIRLVLPLLGFAALGLAAALVVARQQIGSTRGRSLLTASGAFCAAWLLWASLSVWPHGLCYTNELWGGTANGYLCLSDSNYDWGQGLKELAQWQQTHRQQDLHVLYYGTDKTLARLPMRPLVVGDLQLGSDDLPEEVRGRPLAVGVSIVYGSVSEIFPDLKALAQALRRIKPVDRTATFFIYRLPSHAEAGAAANGKEEGHRDGAKTDHETPATAELASGPDR
ncbi:MAG: ArnT family glycosyltransferase [Gemmataceae bacterium]